MDEDAYSQESYKKVLGRLLETIREAQKQMPGKMGSIQVYLGDIKNIYGNLLPKNYGGTFLVVEPQKIYFDPGPEENYLDTLKRLDKEKLEDSIGFIGERINRMSMESVILPIGNDASESNFYHTALYIFPLLS
jgi:hypothetical protein